MSEEHIAWAILVGSVVALAFWLSVIVARLVFGKGK